MWFFFFNDTATTEIYTLSLHDALPISFEPPPEVASALVTLRLPGECAKLSLNDASRFLDFVKLCFSQKRKTLINNLRSLAKPDRVREASASLNLRPVARAAPLPLAQLAALQARLGGS